MSGRMSESGLRMSWTSGSSMRTAPSWARLLSWISGSSRKTPPSWALGTAQKKPFLSQDTKLRRCYRRLGMCELRTMKKLV